MTEEEEKQDHYGKRPLWQWVLLYLIIGVVIYGAVYYFLQAKNGKGYSVSSSKSTTQATPTAMPTAALQKFSDSSEFTYAYKIFPGSFSTESKQAMAGFAFTTKALSDGSTQVTLTSQNQFYKTQQYTVKPGYSLYFIEKNLKDDDAQKDTDAMTLDDSAILVDPQGYIAQ
jgi:hypothetical protein